MVLGLVLLLALSTAQKPGNLKDNKAPALTISVCEASGSCTTQQKSVVMDSNWMWTHKVGQAQNCYTGNEWDKSACPDPKSCAANCALDMGDYEGTYGISTSGNALKIGFVTHGPYSTNVGARLYLLDTEDEYFMFKLLNREFTFDVDVSQLPCGLNGALYFVEMQKDGGLSQYSGNQAGAKYGTGYCDAQCPHDIKFINGEANILDWKTSSRNSGTGRYGTCCVEMDVWESNSMSQALTPHSCQVQGQTRCSGSMCGDNDKGQRYDGVCDKDGCDWADYRLNHHTFYGPGSNFEIDTTKKITVVTQWHSSDGTDTGTLHAIERFYLQDGKRVNVSSVTMGGQSFSSITDQFCNAQKSFFNDTNSFERQGGLKNVGGAAERGMVLVMSLWDDYSVYMLWLDSNYPTTAPTSQPGVARGSCPDSSGRPEDVESQHPNAYVTYSNIRYGPIGSTTSGGSGPSGCPGGSLSACIALCPSDPASAYKACVNSCVARCS